jgi:toxin ParE1/3/4
MQLMRSGQYEEDFDRILDYIANQNPSAAKAIALEIERHVRLLQNFHILAATAAYVVLEVAIPRTPYVAVYSANGLVVLLRLLHGAQNWPRPDLDL